MVLFQEQRVVEQMTRTARKPLRKKNPPILFFAHRESRKAQEMNGATTAELCKRRLFRPTENKEMTTPRRNHAFFAKKATTQRMLVEKW